MRLISYADHPPHTLVLQGNRLLRKNNQAIKIMSKLTNGNKIERTFGSIKDIIKG